MKRWNYICWRGHTSLCKSTNSSHLKSRRVTTHHFSERIDNYVNEKMITMQAAEEDEEPFISEKKSLGLSLIACGFSHCTITTSQRGTQQSSDTVSFVHERLHLTATRSRLSASSPGNNSPWCNEHFEVSFQNARSEKTWSVMDKEPFFAFQKLCNKLIELSLNINKLNEISKRHLSILITNFCIFFFWQGEGFEDIEKSSRILFLSFASHFHFCV